MARGSLVARWLQLVVCLSVTVAALRLSSTLRMSTGSVVQRLTEKLFASVNAEIPLRKTDYASNVDANGWNCVLEWHDEEKGSKLTGVTKAVLTSKTGTEEEEELAYLNTWLSPGYYTPHMLLCIGKSKKGGYSIEADYVPRGPNAFGQDQTYLDTYFSKDVIDWYDLHTSLPNAVSSPPSKSFSARLIRSPAHIAITGLTEEQLSACATAHVERWIAWMSTAKPSEARQKGALNGRDDKLRQFYFRSALFDSINRVGAEQGKALAVGLTGPLAEAYVGGGS